ncbi:mannosyltransferase [Phlyctochytrium planicorne]|nr:mannosyltransferase [Phlyctochytrium planicorne]
MFVRLVAAALSHISDCDEVFNYWEPAHFLQYGYGLQTWEYSPKYAIRSWAYVEAHAEIGKLLARSFELTKGFMMVVDRYYYGRFEIIPANIVLYNVFSGKEKGPNIFGTEPCPALGRLNSRERVRFCYGEALDTFVTILHVVLYIFLAAA